MALNRSAGMSGAWLRAISALVLAGLPSTRIRTSSAATALIASPWGLKIPPLACNRSDRSMPGPRGRAPTSRHTELPSNACFGSSVMSTPASSRNAQSSSSIAVPSAALRAGGISSSRSRTGVSGPSMAPDAIRKSSAYPICPAAPVTVTVVGCVCSSVFSRDWCQWGSVQVLAAERSPAALTRRALMRSGRQAGSGRITLGVIRAGLLVRAVAVQHLSVPPVRAAARLSATPGPDLFGPGRLPLQRCCRLQGGARRPAVPSGCWRRTGRGRSPRTARCRR